jgi:predicted DNA-binding transcriptional regulator YafY
MTMLLESTRAERVAVLTWRLLTAGELLTAEEAQRFGVSTRTIQRDLAEISRVLAVRPDYAGRWLAPEEMRISLY